MSRDPIQTLLYVVTTPIEDIAKALGFTVIDAAEHHRKVMTDLAPYLERRPPPPRPAQECGE